MQAAARESASQRQNSASGALGQLLSAARCSKTNVQTEHVRVYTADGDRMLIRQVAFKQGFEGEIHTSSLGAAVVQVDQQQTCHGNLQHDLVLHVQMKVHLC